VAKHAETHGSLALSRRPRDPARTPPRTVVGVLPRRPAQPAEIAQARVFERLLQAECAELSELAQRIAADEPDDSTPSEEVTQIRARIDEVVHLLRALQGRFPHSAPEGDR
jgi:hypothetical protein